MTHLIPIGNSQGIRIPKALIEQADLQNHLLELKIVNEGLLIKPAKKARDNWEASISAILQEEGEDSVDDEWINSTLTDDNEWEW